MSWRTSLSRPAPSAVLLLAAERAARDQQAGQVRAGDEQHAEGGAEERLQQEPRLSRDVLPQGDDRGADLGVLRVRALELGRHHAHLGPGLLERDAALALGQDEQVRVPAVLEVVLREAEAGPDLCLAVREAEVRRHHADHGVGFLVQQDRSPHHARIRPEAAGPEAVAEQRRARRSLADVGLAEPTAQAGRAAQHGEHAGGDGSGVELLRIAAVHEVHGDEAVGRHALEAGAHPLPVPVVRR
jgi:hypothetical protein